MHHQTLKLILMLLALTGPAAWGFAQQTVTIVTTGQGTVTADKTEARQGELVTLTVSAAEGWMLRRERLAVEMVTDAEGDTAHLTRSAAPLVGSYVSVSRQGDGLYAFRMPDTRVEVRAAFVAYTTQTATIPVTVTDGSTSTAAEATITIAVEDETDEAVISNVALPGTDSQQAVSVVIPETVTNADGQENTVTAIGSGALTDCQGVTDIYLPDTDEPLVIADDALTTGDGSGVPTIHTPLTLLDDYALMTGLSQHYATGNITATAQARNRYWTFSCGVDVRLPQGTTFFICRQSSTTGIEIIEQHDAVILANNGVLIACDDDRVHDYEVTVSPSGDRPTSTVPSTHNARSYEGNLLEPVIKNRHYDAGGYYVMVDNAFHPIIQEDRDVELPACKAVLHLEE